MDHREALLRRYVDKLKTNADLSRALVSFQANKQIPFYRWFKYKEAFSCNLIKYVLQKFAPNNMKRPRLLDPFAGAGTALNFAAAAGWKTTGIELLPVSGVMIRARLAADTVSLSAFSHYLQKFERFTFNSLLPKSTFFQHLRITQHAFSTKTERCIAAYQVFLGKIKNPEVRLLFWFACLSILEEVSYTRKDGQYLRWDSRCGRKLKSKFNKGHIASFDSAIRQKLTAIWEDLQQRNGGHISKNIKLIEGSCLEELPRLTSDSIDLVLTSPPYCNRYDYTRTYALELAFLGYTEEMLKQLRQTLLSATVENRSKAIHLSHLYKSRNQNRRYNKALSAFCNQAALQEVLDRLYEAQKKGELNNPHIPNLVEHYFFEMNLVIHELARVVAPGGRIVMVNDNVQYHGEEVPVDLILSDLAVAAGMSVETIWVLPRGKGNSSQQMGAHGRNELRKCVYVWSKPE